MKATSVCKLKLKLKLVKLIVNHTKIKTKITSVSVLRIIIKSL